MGVLNCQKCINQENKLIDELLLGGKEPKRRRVITALECQDTNTTPQKSQTYYTEEGINRLNNTNNINQESKEEKIKRIYLEIKKGNKDAIYDLDYNTLEIICNDSDSYQDFLDKKSEKYINIDNNQNNNKEEIVDIQKILSMNGNEDLNINDFINQKIKESQDSQFQGEEINKKNNEIFDNPRNYKIIYDKNMINYPSHLNYNDFSDFELSEDGNYNNINDKIIEEKDEYENENEESNIKKVKELRHYSANLSHKKNKSIEINKIKLSLNSATIKGNEHEKENINSLNSINLNNISINKQQGGRSIVSYEIESDQNIDNINIHGNNIYNSIENSDK